MRRERPLRLNFERTSYEHADSIRYIILWTASGHSYELLCDIIDVETVTVQLTVRNESTDIAPKLGPEHAGCGGPKNFSSKDIISHASQPCGVFRRSASNMSRHTEMRKYCKIESTTS